MPREIITVNIGGCGVNIGQSQLTQYCIEQGIGSNGKKEHETLYDNNIVASFEELSNGQYVARTLFLDLDPFTIENIRKRYKYRNVLQEEYLMNGKEETGLNFAKGHYTTGKENIDQLNEALRTMVEACDNCQGFIINHSMGGGTGSGFATLVLERIAVDYRRKTKMAFDIFPNQLKLMSNMEIYNCLLCLHWLLDHTEISIIIDNMSLYRRCKLFSNIKGPTYNDYNNIITRYASNITANTRFAQNEGLTNIHVGMVPYPRLHFLTPSMSPLQFEDEEKKEENVNEMQSLIGKCLSTDNFLIDYLSFDPIRDKYISIAFGFRGKEIEKNLNDIDEALLYMNTSNKVSWTQWTCDKPTTKFIKG